MDWSILPTISTFTDNNHSKILWNNTGNHFSMEGIILPSNKDKAIKRAETTVKITRLARGLPAGGELDYLDEATLSQALYERIDVNQGIGEKR